MIVAIARGWFETLERDIVHTVTCTWDTPFWNRTFRAVQKDELAIPLVLLVVLLIALSSPRRAFRCLVSCSVALGLAMLVASALWLVVDRKRPPFHYERWLRTPGEQSECADHPEWLALHKSPSRRPSFPSRHGLTTGVFVTGFWLASRKLGLAAAAYALIVAVGRVFVGKHWPSDVLAGLVIGGLLTWVVWRLVPYLFAKIGREAWVLEDSERGPELGAEAPGA